MKGMKLGCGLRLAGTSSPYLAEVLFEYTVNQVNLVMKQSCHRGWVFNRKDRKDWAATEAGVFNMEKKL